jgi:hypothetical protein
VRYAGDTGQIDWLVPKTHHSLKDTALVNVGGDPIRYPLAFFVSREKAFEAAASFLLTGKATKEIPWVRLNEQEWEWEP